MESQTCNDGYRNELDGATIALEHISGKVRHVIALGRKFFDFDEGIQSRKNSEKLQFNKTCLPCKKFGTLRFDGFRG